MKTLAREEYEREYWQEAATDPDVDVKYISDLSTEQCIEALEKSFSECLAKGHPRVAELGVGVGRLILPLANKYPNAEFAGLDISSNMLDIAKKSDNKRLIKGWALLDGRDIPLVFGADTKYDAIYSVLVFQHIDRVGICAYFKTIFESLKEGGLFRFQFIEGDEHEPFSHHYDKSFIIQLLMDNNAEMIDYEVGLVHPQWTWITARAK